MTKENASPPTKRSESDVYDRQIRLWGADAQAKMSKAKVLYIHVTGVSSEIMKNLVLAGIKPAICDIRAYPDAVLDTPSIFLPAQDRANNNDNDSNKKNKYQSVAHAVKPVLEELNPLLGDCEIVEKSVSELDQEFLSQFLVVVASRISMEDAIRLSCATTASGGTFFMVDCFGMRGACVLDLGEKHTFRPEKGKKLLEETTLETHVPLESLFKVSLADATHRRFHKTPPPVWVSYRCILEYVEQTKSWPSPETAQDFVEKTRAWVKETCPSMLEHEALSEASLQELAKVATSDVAPVCATLGGVIGNECIKAISGKGEPANNTILFDGLSCKTTNFLVKPKEDE